MVTTARSSPPDRRADRRALRQVRSSAPRLAKLPQVSTICDEAPRFATGSSTLPGAWPVERHCHVGSRGDRPAVGRKGDPVGLPPVVRASQRPRSRRFTRVGRLRPQRPSRRGTPRPVRQALKPCPLSPHVGQHHAPLLCGRSHHGGAVCADSWTKTAWWSRPRWSRRPSGTRPLRKRHSGRQPASITVINRRHRACQHVLAVHAGRRCGCCLVECTFLSSVLVSLMFTSGRRRAIHASRLG
jgi:hypothetical protein